MDRGADPTHVGHVRRTGVGIVALIPDAVGGHIRSEAVGQDAVIAHRPGQPGENHLHGRVCRERRGLAQVSKARPHRAVLGFVVAPDHEPGGRPVRDDVGGRAALPDDAVDPSRRPQLLPPQPDRREQQDQRIKCVLPAPRVGRRMRLQPVKDDLGILRGKRMAGHVIPIARMEQQSRVESLEQAVVDHDLLAAPALLGRGSKEDDLTGQSIGDRGQRDRGTDARRGHRVVATAVAKAGKGVVLGEDPDPRPVGAPSATLRRTDRGGEGARGKLHGVAVPGEDVSHPGGRLVLLECRLGMRVDLVGEPQDLGSGRFDCGSDARLPHREGLRWFSVCQERHAFSRLTTAVGALRLTLPSARC